MQSKDKFPSNHDEAGVKKLAINGGKPARMEPLPPHFPGAMAMDQDEIERVAQVIQGHSPFRYYGPNVQGFVSMFEDEMSARLQTPYALGVTSCTAALITALKALGVGYGDKVIVPAITFIATAGAVIACQAVPVFVDVDDSLNINVDDLERVYDEEVKAIIAVHLMGHPCEMDRLMQFSRQYGIPVIEDVAQSCGVQYRGKPGGTIGDIGVFSFQMNKLLTAGEGGAIVTRSPALFERAVRYHDQGQFREQSRYGFGDRDEEIDAFCGQNYRMSELTGAVLLEQWRKLDGILASMKSNYRTIRHALEAALPDVQFRSDVDKDGDIGYSLGIIVPSAVQAQRVNHALEAENIRTFLLYGGKAVYRFPQIFWQRTAEARHNPFHYPFKQPVRYSENMCPRAEDLVNRTLFLPVSAMLQARDLEEIITGIVKVFQGIGRT